ncbi:hypothetical protein R3P38DRAFT_3624331 [Favolaschia claudopus]|uniref:Uncharacterized protein n=1 Tax=Favolaschia claudopus TaxID=2862362 RepID=A0AAW0A0S2_9AGAR
MAASSRKKGAVECTAQDKDSDQECTCTEFRELKDTVICGQQDCYHRKKYHLSVSEDTGDSEVHDLLTKIANKSSGSSASTSMLAKLSKARAGLGSPSSASSSTSRKAAANSESNRGMRPKKSKNKQNQSTNNNFRVASIMVLPCGTKVSNKTRQLPSKRRSIPSRQEIQLGIISGLAVLRNEQGIELDRSADHDDFKDSLREGLPHVFGYFDRIEEESGEPAWVGSATSGFRYCRPFIVSNKPIPKEILETWVDQEALRAYQGTNTGSDNDSEETNSDDEDGEGSRSISPESTSAAPFLRPMKRRSETGEDSEEPVKKKTKLLDLASAALSEIDNLDDDNLIDLTVDTDDVREKTPPPAPVVPPALSPEFKVNSSLGNPYGNIIYDF